MDKRSAIQAMLDGKKICNINFNNGCYIEFRGHIFYDQNNSKTNINYMEVEGWELYEEPPKTESWAKFRAYNGTHRSWIEFDYMYKTLDDFKDEFAHLYNHHEIPNTRVDLPVVED